MFRAIKAISPILVAVLLLCVARPALALGISPPEIVSDNAFNGVVQTKYVHISRNPLDVGDLRIVVSAKEEYASYLQYEPEVIMPASEDFIDFAIGIAPTTAAPGTYAIPVFFIIEKIPSGDAAQSTGTEVVTGIALRVKFTVTGDRVTGYTLNNLSLDPVEAEILPVLLVGITNTGNVDWKPTGAKLTFSDQNDPDHVVAFDLAGDRFEVVPAGQTSQTRIELKDYLSEGDYVATMDVYDGDLMVGTLVSNPFTVYPNGTLSQSGELSEVTAKKAVYAPGERVMLSATFRNTGQLGLTGVLMTEVYKNGTYVDLVRGEELRVDPSQESSFAQDLTLNDPGAYTLTSYVKFGSKKTVTKDVDIAVEVPVVVAAVNSTQGIGALSGIILLLVILFVLRRRILALFARRERKTENAPAVSAVPSPTVAPTEPPAPTTDENARW